jgi:hypothetical protein
MEETAPNSAGWVRAHCPWCEELGHHSRVKNLAINPETGYYKCWRSFHCGTVGFLFERAEQTYSPAYVAINGPSAQELVKKRNAGPTPTDLDDFQLIDVEKPGIGLPYYMYLRKRRVSNKAIVANGIGFATSGLFRNRVIVPFRHDGKYMGSVARVLGESSYAYRNSSGFVRDSMFNVDALRIETPEPVAIVEGLFDALPHWPYAVACLGKPTDNQVEIIAQAKRPVVMFLDGDARMENRGTMLRLALRGAPVRAVYLPPAIDPGDISHATFLEYLLGDKQ